MEYISFSDIHVYLTMAGSYRAYLKSNPELEAWGGDRRAAVNNLCKILVQKEIPFDVSHAPWFVSV